MTKKNKNVKKTKVRKKKQRGEVKVKSKHKRRIQFDVVQILKHEIKEEHVSFKLNQKMILL